MFISLVSDAVRLQEDKYALQQQLLYFKIIWRNS